MQQVLKQSTAATTVVGPILDSTGAVYTGAVIADLNLTKNGTTAAMAAAATLTHDHNGHYLLVFTTTNTDTLGRLDVTCNKATYAMPPKCFEVLGATAFDTLVTNGTLASTTSGRTIATDASGFVTVGTNNDKTGYTLAQAFPTNFSSLSIDASGRVDLGKALGTAVTLDANNVLNVSTKYLGGTLQTARDIGASVLLSPGTGTGQLDFTSGVVKANLVQYLGTASPAADTAGYPKVTLKSGTGAGELSLSAGLVSLSSAQTFNMTGSVSGSVGSISGVTFPTNFGVLSISAVTGLVDITQAAADKVWSTTTRLLTAGTNIVLAKGTGVTGFNDLSAAQVNAEADTALADVGLTTTITGRIDVATSTRLATAGYTAPDNAGIAATKAVTDKLDTALALNAGTYRYTAAALALAPTGGGGTAPTANENADALLDRAAGVETGWTVRQVLRVMSAVMLGKSSVDGTVFRDLNDTKDRVTATVSGFNRTAVTKDAT